MKHTLERKSDKDAKKKKGIEKEKTRKMMRRLLKWRLFLWFWPQEIWCASMRKCDPQEMKCLSCDKWSHELCTYDIGIFRCQHCVWLNKETCNSLVGLMKFLLKLSLNLIYFDLPWIQWHYFLRTYIENLTIVTRIGENRRITYSTQIFFGCHENFFGNH